MRLDDEQAIDELARALASQHPSFTDLQDEAKRTLKREFPHLGEAALAREHLIINQLRENQPHARDMVSAWLEGVDGTKGDPNAVSTIRPFDGTSILARAVTQLKVGTVRLLLSHGAKVESEILFERSLCEKGRARPPAELARLFALDKFIFWRVLSFWRSEREMPVCLMNTDVPAPPPPKHRFLPEERFLPAAPEE